MTYPMTKITGHRGARDLWPENSLTGFRNALALGIDDVEFDVHLTDAGELLVIHDPTLERTTDGTGPVRALRPENRGTVRLQGCDETIPTFDDVLDLLEAKPSLWLHIEIKNDADGRPYPGLPAKVIERLRARGLETRCYLTSFTPAVLEECRRLAPEIARLISMNEKSVRNEDLDAMLTRALEIADVVAVQMDLLDRNWTAITKRVPPSRICAWVANTPSDLTTWLGRGLLYVTSDRPDLALRIRKELADANV